MVEEPSQVNKWTYRLVVYVGLVAGLVLLAAAVRSDEPPWWWWVGILLVAVCGSAASGWIWFRLRYRSKEERDQYIARLQAKRQVMGQPLDRSRIAYRATKHKKAVLRSGVDGTAVVTFLADGRRANEFHQLVYLELEVSTPGGPEPYQVRTGEFITNATAGSVSPGRRLRIKVDPADPQRVAVDWDRSLRLN